MAVQPSGTPTVGTNRPQSTFQAPRGLSSQQLDPLRDVGEYLKTYFREKPDVAALWCFGIGFVVGWKLKPW